MQPDAQRNSPQGKEVTCNPADVPSAADAPAVEEPAERTLEEFVYPFYSPRDTLHGLPHLRRVLKKAHYLARHHASQIDMAVLVHAAYLHGLIFQEETRIQRFLQGRPLTPEQIER